jgi:hypothetical protein
MEIAALDTPNEATVLVTDAPAKRLPITQACVFTVVEKVLKILAKFVDIFGCSIQN